MRTHDEHHKFFTRFHFFTPLATFGLLSCAGASLGCLLLSTPRCSSAPTPLDQWQWRNPLPNGNSPNRVSYANGIFVGVGEAITTSLDGTNWISQNLGPIYGVGTSYAVFGIAWGNNTWVAVGIVQPTGGAGSYALILTSPDLITWTPRVAPENVSGLRDVTYGNGMFVAVGSARDPDQFTSFGAVLTSTDGVHWDVHDSGIGDAFLDRVVYGSGRFVVVSPYGTIVRPMATILTSVDALNWTVWESDTLLFLHDITCGPDRYVVAGDAGLLVSIDGLTWTNHPAPSHTSMSHVAYGNGLYVAVGNNLIVSSVDTIKWTVSGMAPDIWDLAFGDGKFVGVGDAVLLVSTNASSWANLASSVTTAFLRGVVYEQGFVAVGEKGTILSSADGVQWNSILSGLTSRDLFGTACGAGIFAAVGSQGTILTWRNDASWVKLTNAGDIFLYSVTYAKGQFVAVGTGGVILTSTNGNSWAPQDSGVVSALRGVAYGQGMFIVGAGTGVLISVDGLTWNHLDIAALSNVTLDWPAGLAYGRGVFVGVANTGLILTSTNGEDWGVVNSGTTADLYSVAYGNGTFLVTGSAGTILSSTNGFDWTAHDSGTMNPIFGACYGAGTFIAVGASGTILQSGAMPLQGTRLDPVPGWSNGAFGVSLIGPLGEWRIEASSDLFDWIPIGNIRTTNTPALFMDGDASKFDRRFYRAVAP